MYQNEFDKRRDWLSCLLFALNYQIKELRDREDDTNNYPCSPN